VTHKKEAVNKQREKMEKNLFQKTIEEHDLLNWTVEADNTEDGSVLLSNPKTGVAAYLDFVNEVLTLEIMEPGKGNLILNIRGDVLVGRARLKAEKPSYPKPVLRGSRAEIALIIEWQTREEREFFTQMSLARKARNEAMILSGGAA
jgi:hypothetical protein